jgi:hypothetical protein
LIVRVTRRLSQRQDRGEAGVAAFEERRPLAARTRNENRGESCGVRPVLRIVLSPRQRHRGAYALEQVAVEMRLNRADRDVAAVGATVATKLTSFTMTSLRLSFLSRPFER